MRSSTPNRTNQPNQPNPPNRTFCISSVHKVSYVLHMTNDHQPCRCNKPALRIPLVLPDRDERLKFVEHVLDVLSESRTGRRRIYRIEAPGCPTWLTELEIDLPDSFYNLTGHLRLHAQRFFSIARSNCRRIEGLILTPVRRAMAILTGPGVQPAAFPCSPLQFRGSLPLPRGSP